VLAVVLRRVAVLGGRDKALLVSAVEGIPGMGLSRLSTGTWYIKGMSNGITLLRAWWLLLSLHFLGAYHCYLAALSDRGNRMTLLWQRSDIWDLFLALAVPAAAAAAAGLLIRRRCAGEPGRRAFHQLWILYAAVAGWSFLGRASAVQVFPRLAEFLPLGGGVAAIHVIEGALKAAALGAGGYWALRGPVRLSRLLQLLILVLSPVVPIALGQALFLRTYRVTSDAPTATPAPGPGVYLFLFDEWSYERTFSGSRPRPDLPRLRELAGQAVVAHRAFSPRTITLESVPRLLSMAPLGLVQHDAITFDRRMSEVLSDNVFRMARIHGFATYAAGYYLPYADWFGADLDHARCFTGLKPRDLPARLLHTLWRLHRDNLILRIPPLDAWLTRRVYRDLCLARLQGVHSAALGEAGRPGGRAFDFFHYPLPHDMVTQNREFGDASGTGGDPAALYGAALRDADRLLGELMDGLKSAGKWEDSLVVFTSDHGWRDDPQPVQPETSSCHVPLIIKLPRQRRGEDSLAAFDTRRLREILRDAARGGVSEGALRASAAVRHLRSGRRDELSTCDRLPYPPL